MHGHTRNQIEDDVINLAKAGADVESLLHFMRERGFNEADSLHPLMRAACLDLGSARDLIIESRTWADHREANIKLQEDFMEALLQASKDDPNVEIIIESDSEER